MINLGVNGGKRTFCVDLSATGRSIVFIRDLKEVSIDCANGPDRFRPLFNVQRGLDEAKNRVGNHKTFFLFITASVKVIQD